MKGFIDEAKIHAIAGAGGNGSVSFHSEPFKPKGGPDGGDGGDGGSVILRADRGVGTLHDVHDHPHLKAERGKNGERGKRQGRRGTDKLVLVPVGTVVYDEDGVVIADLANAEDEFIAAKGGRGGRGNVRFATATRRSPGFSEQGEPGETRDLRLELRLLADVGLVGFPNAGKSTLVSRISAAKPKIADYPFTTLTPNLGVVKHSDEAFVVADIPGLVEGAHTGKGLGHRFLRHVRRAAVLLFMVDLTAQDRDPLQDVVVLLEELRQFDAELADRPRLIAATKADVTTTGLDELRTRYPDLLVISSVTGEGIPELLRELSVAVKKARAETPAAVGYTRYVVRETPLSVKREDQGWRVVGTRVERAVAQTDMSNDEAVSRLQRRMQAMGVERKLQEAGAKRGQAVKISDLEFTFEPDEPDEETSFEETEDVET